MKNQNGQALLIVLLVMAVVLTIVLSVLGSSTSDIKISSNETESLRAFSAAESGIEKALITNLATQGSIDNANYNTTISSLAVGSTSYNYPTNISSGDEGILWFASHANDGTLACNPGLPCFRGSTIKVCWGKEGTSGSSATTPAIDLTVYYLGNTGDYSTAAIAKGIYDPNGGRLATNSYQAADPGTCSVNGKNYAFNKVVNLNTLGVPPASYNFTNGLQFMTVRFLYNSDQDQSLAFDVNFAGDGNLPSQGQILTSVGNVNTVTRKIEVSSPYVGIPPIFDTAIFGTGGVIQ